MQLIVNTLNKIPLEYRIEVIQQTSLYSSIFILCTSPVKLSQS